MSRSTSTTREPLFLHVSKRTPVTVHIRPTATRSLAKQGDVERKRSRGRSTVSTTGTSATKPSRTRSGQQLASKKLSHSLSSKKKSSAQYLHPKVSWEGSTHRLEIHPPTHSVETEGDGEREHATLRMSDLGTDKEVGGEGVGPTTDEKADFESRIQALQDEVDALTSRLEEEHVHSGIPLTRSQLHRHDIASAPAVMRVHDRAASLMSSKLQEQMNRREELVRRLEEMEKESHTVTKHMDKLHSSVKKLSKAPSLVPSQLGVQRSKLMQKMSEFQQGSRSLRKLLREQWNQESCAVTYDPTQSTAAVDHNLALHTQGLHDELERKEVELQSLLMHTQSLEEQLQKREQECAELQTSLHECKMKAQQEKESLKRAARHHKHRAMHSQHATERLEQQLQETNCELEEARSKLTQLSSEKMRQQTELSSLSMRVKDLNTCLTQSKASSESAVGAVSARLTEKTQELNLVQLENNRLKTTLNTMEGALKVMETNSARKISSLEAELAQTRATSSQYEALSEEYKNQLERCHRECEEIQSEVRRRDRDLERLQQDTSTEMEKCRMKYDQRLSELEPLPELLKVSELRVQELQQRLSVCEKRAVEQSRLVDELTAKYDQQCGCVEEMTHKWHEAVAENKSLLSRLDTALKRMEESDSQNRALVATAGQKEESMQKLQSHLDECQATISSLQAQLHSTTSESRRQQEHLRDKAAGKERAHLARIADLESQISRSNSLNSQLRTSKDEAERLHQSRLRSLQEQLDASNTSRRSMETYVNFLKASYSSLYSETDKHSAPPFHMLN